MDQASLLALSRNPFAPTRNPANRIPNASFEGALAGILSRVKRGEPLIALVGAPGTGKTLLLEAARRALGKDGPVRTVARGDLLEDALNASPATLLVDEGERAPASTLARLIGGAWPLPVVAVGRFPASVPEAAVVRLRALSAREARAHVLGHLARPGRQKLFSRAALDAVVAAAGGNPRTLSLVAGSALFMSEAAGASGVEAAHVRSAVEMRGIAVPPALAQSVPNSAAERVYGFARAHTRVGGCRGRAVGHGADRNSRAPVRAAGRNVADPFRFGVRSASYRRDARAVRSDTDGVPLGGPGPVRRRLAPARTCRACRCGHGNAKPPARQGARRLRRCVARRRSNRGTVPRPGTARIATPVTRRGAPPGSAIAIARRRRRCDCAPGRHTAARRGLDDRPAVHAAAPARARGPGERARRCPRRARSRDGGVGRGLRLRPRRA